IDWLPDYFFKTDGGTWRLPASPEEQQLKENARKGGTNRRIKRFVALLQSGAEIPPRLRPGPATLAEWVRHAKRNGMYQEGKLLYERGGLDASKLSDEAAASVEEDYQTCVRALQRTASPAT